MTTDLITRARIGDSDAFRELTEPHRRELQVHCYRICALTRFENTVLPWFGLPRSLPD